MSIVGVLTKDGDLVRRCRSLGSEGELSVVDLGLSGSLVMVANGTSASSTEKPLMATGHGPIAANTFIGSYRERGVDFMAAEDAHLAAALWDADSRSLHLYRGRTGIPPVFYWTTDDGIAWATTMRDLLALSAPREVDRLALAEYQLSGFIQAPRTILAGIRKLPAYHRLTWHEGRQEISSYWRPQWEPKEERPVEQQARDVEQILVASIEAAIPSSNRLGILLSGGIDSVCLAALASQRTDAEVTGFTFDYSDYEGKFNESEVAGSIADRLGMGHEVIPIDSEYVIDQFPRLVAQYEEPFSYGVHSARLGPLTDHGVDVALTGAVGATWTLSGASRTATRMHHRLPGWLLDGGAAVTRRLPSRGTKLETGMRLAAMSDSRRYLALSQQTVMPDAHLEGMWNEPGSIAAARSAMVGDLERATPTVVVEDRFAALGLTAFGAEHLAWWSHRWGEAAGVSLRFPYMEKDYVDYLGTLANRPPDSPERRLIAARYLPREVAYAPKTPQTLPIDVWLAGPLYDFARETLSREAITGDGTFDYDEIERRLEEHRTGRQNHKWSIWTVLCYLIWKRDFLETLPVTR